MEQNLNEILEIGPSQQTPTADSLDEAPAQIGGWLILPAIGLILSMALAVVGIVMALMIADRLPSRYQEVFALSLFAEFGILMFVIYVATRFYRKRRNTPEMMIALMVAGIAVNGVLMLIEIGADAEPFAIESGKAMIRGIISAAIWIPYFRISKRVKRTFVVP